MPCNDITEILDLEISPDDKIQKYRLYKRTCGSLIGNPTLIIDWLKNRHISEILNAAPGSVLPPNFSSSILNEFLRLKHFFAVQIAIKTFLGHEENPAQRPCQIEKVSHFPDGSFELQATIKIDIITEKITACGNCEKCVP